MWHNILSVRVNLALVLVGAFSVMLLIKLTALLPAQYYFSFSKLVAGDRGPFLVDPPSISGAKLCELMRKNRISADDLASAQIDCKLGRLSSQGGTVAPPFSPEAIDAIYNSVLTYAPALQERTRQLASEFKIQPMPREELDKLLAEAQSVDAAVKAMLQHYRYQVTQGVGQPLRQNVDYVLAAVPEPQYTGSVPEELSLPPLSEDDLSRLRAAHDVFIQKISVSAAVTAGDPVRKSQLDTFVETAYGKYGLASKITSHYTEPIETRMEDTLKSEVAAQGLSLRSSEALEQVVFQELSVAGLRDYAAAVLIRLAAVLLFGIVAGIAFGRHELLSISIAAALAAFLLSWPLMLMWENLVDPRWNDQRPLFLVFYGIYILSFFFTARFGAVIGAIIRRGLMRRPEPLVATGSGGAMTNIVTFRDFVVNLSASVLINVAVYATNVVIPLTASFR